MRRMAIAAHDARTRPLAARAARQCELRIGDIDHEPRRFTEEKRPRLRRAIERQRHAAGSTSILYEHAMDRRRDVRECAAAHRNTAHGSRAKEGEGSTSNVHEYCESTRSGLLSS